MTEQQAASRAGIVRTVVQTGASLALLVATLWVVDASDVARRLRLLDLRWLLVTLGLLGAQLPLLAARWWFFARLLVVPIAYPRALAEYALASLLNQVLPFGILGDVGRAVRQVRVADNARPAPVVLAIVLERASGQIALWLVVAAVLPAWWRALGRQSRWPTSGLPLGLVVVAGLGLAGMVGLLAWRRLSRDERLRGLASSGLRALLSPGHAIVHLPLSFSLLASHVLAFVAIAHGLGLRLPVAQAFTIVPLVLVATTLPTFLAGWGIREATLAGLYHLVGLHPADGVTIALVYGALSLLASTPGVVALWSKRGPWRKGAG
jgi:uncharacterized membrane protein YbhN (UPF0104 family)